MANALTYLPELDDSELVYVNSLFANMTNDQAQQFAMVYRARRKMTAEYNQHQAYLVAQLIQTNSTGSMSAQ